MENVLIKWMFDLITEFAKFGTWLTTDLPYLNIPPIAVISFGGLTLILGFLLVRLVIGG